MCSLVQHQIAAPKTTAHLVDRLGQLYCGVCCGGWVHGTLSEAFMSGSLYILKRSASGRDPRTRAACLNNASVIC